MMTSRIWNWRRTLFIGLALFSGCASLAHGPLERIDAASEPAGADVIITCQGKRTASGVTPTQMMIHRKAEGCVADFSKDGFLTARMEMDRGVGRAYWGNAALAGGIPLAFVVAFSDGGSQSLATGIFATAIAGAGGLVYDRLSGAMYDHPAHLSVRLQPAPTSRQE